MDKSCIERKVDPKKVYSLDEFIDDWWEVRDRHSGQMQVLESFFVDNSQYIFNRAGRKFAKTTTNIDIAWRFAHEHPKSVIYFCFPTITQAIEVVWDEERLQNCDIKELWMNRKYVKSTDDSKHIVYFKNGSFIKLIGTWSEKRGRGTQPDLLIVDEIQDCSGDYLDAMDPNLAAKDGRCIMSGTPPKKRNHYHDWEHRIRNNQRGRIFHFPSHANDKLEHLSIWLENKRLELINAKKEDVWIREYLAQDCFSSAERVLPDPIIESHEILMQDCFRLNFKQTTPIVAICTQGNYISCLLCLLNERKEVFIFDMELDIEIWDKSYVNFVEKPSFKEKIKNLQKYSVNRLRYLIWDPTKSFKDVIRGFTECRKDPKWQDRGIPLFKEMIIQSRIKFSDNVSQIEMECQNLLHDENDKAIEKNYPLICTISMLINEYFTREKFKVENLPQFDKYQALRDAGLPIPTRKRAGVTLFKQQ